MSLTTLPPELRHQILSSVIWTPTAIIYHHLDLFRQDPPRVRLRDDWDIWVPATSPQPTALQLILTCRILRDDVLHLLNASTASLKSHHYEIDIVFIPKCGLFPTWVCCPLPSQFNLDTLRASFRIMDVEDIDEEVEKGRQGEFLRRYQGVSSDFDADYPNPPSGSWNFYRLLVSFLALGPRGLCSPAYQRQNRGSLLSSKTKSPPRYSLHHLIISVTTKVKTRMDKKRWKHAHCGAQRWLLARHDDLPYGCGKEAEIFPGPPYATNDDDRFTQYEWTGPTCPRSVRGMHMAAGRETLGEADRCGLYLAYTLWTLLDFGGWLSRGCGLVLYESILDDITFYVDGESRPRFGIDDLLRSFLERPEPPKPSRTMTPEVAAALKIWKKWVVKWRTWRKNKLREGRSRSGSAACVLDADTSMEPGPGPRPSFDIFARYLPPCSVYYDPNDPEDSSDSDDSGWVPGDDADENLSVE
ncbi:hypothetical protein B0T20DRAFT_93196 [Sordaria brevicollis]|uniref:Uncharacterized protein n=1 Tax=Sordaria brevicollis TaxID=83679 RepID=A0AAE0NX40_SORBR|nr:hypothetical protein B0T20DRAFT_93196 [Sordaria brevicollis]